MTLHDYTATFRCALRPLGECSPRVLWKLGYNFCWRNLWGMAAFERRMAKDEPFFPAFVMISITERCNLHCSGCWVSAGGQHSLSLEQIDGIIREGKKHGSYFFGILGGEPLLYKGLLGLLERHADAYFQLFTNGHFLSAEVAERLRRMGNVTPLISVEGLEEESDRRRGRKEVYAHTLNGVAACREAGLFFGVAASICRSNFNDLVNRQHIERMAAAGAHYLWYYIYRPVGAEPHPENALTKEQIRDLRQFLVEQRKDAPLFLIDTYWDDKGQAICPAATGMSHHISPTGAVEFCPPLQMAKEQINADASNLTAIFAQSSYLAGLRKLTAQTSRGCILLEDPEKLAHFVDDWQAEDSTSRATVRQELATMRRLPGHDMREEAIPEQSPFYRLLKKRYFFGFGAYG